MICDTNGEMLLLKPPSSWKSYLGKLSLELCILSRLNPRAQGEHPTSPPSWMAALLSVARIFALST